MKLTTLTAVAFAFAAIALPAAAEQMAAHTMTTPMGPVMANDKGMTLYTFDQDSGGMSACSGPCAQNWPPLAAPADAKANGDWTVVARDDGSKQWAYKGKPLYGFVKDMKPGDTMGDGVKGVWHAAKP
jgi:predicted lipoprotein with Yx(FWY)xxD motif